MSDKVSNIVPWIGIQTNVLNIVKILKGLLECTECKIKYQILKDIEMQWMRTILQVENECCNGK